ncbi:MAG: DUF4924 family protein [Bacteroidales bacterium]|jgi:hypothetical protein|nr:DUF4924 family protein [Bacteroidales bacterium]MDY0314502.1 DUF4924 family protein [Bacteroidales bacterium]NLB85996.1 DUF4924 family protein [Bacteroidales bacterium]
MIIAEEKYNENIVEYIIYIRQIQDILRLVNFDVEEINKLIIEQYKTSEKIKLKIKNWYLELIKLIKLEKIEKQGDFEFIKKIIDELEALHQTLLKGENSFKHNELYRWAKPNIEEFKKLSNNSAANDVGVCINALHSLLLLRMKNQNISDETMQAMQTFSNLMANLAFEYKKLKS